MERGSIFVLIMLSFILTVISMQSVVSQSSLCNLNVSLINQDPYPVIPGDYVEIVFQISGTDNSDCEGARFKVLENYPFSLDGESSASREIVGDTFVKDYKSSWMIPYRLRVDKDALDGMNEIEVKYGPGSSKSYTHSKKFDIKVEDVRVDFEVSVKDYDPSVDEITFEILNIGEHDVEALTVDIPEQESLDVKGSPRKIIGSLDSNEETTFNFNLIPSKKEIDLEITYTDEINERRSLIESVYFNSESFKSSQKDEGIGFWTYAIAIGIVVIIAFWIRKKKKEKRKRMSKRRE